MFVLRIGGCGPSCSVKVAESMPPHKKLKTESVCEEESQSQSNVAAVLEPDYGAEWREKCVDTCSRNYYALRKNILSDVTFIVGQEECTIQGHRLLLALASPVFEAMFYGGLAEKGDTVTIPDVDPEGFKNLLRFLYTDRVSFKNDVEAFKTFFVADKYCISKLKEECECYLNRCELTPSSVWIYLESSLYLNSKPIKDRCSQLLAKNAQYALIDRSFLDVNAKTVELLLDINHLNVSEMDLIVHVACWASYKAKQSESDSYEDILRSLLPLMRFGILTPKDFITLRRGMLKDVLNVQDSLAILEHIIKPEDCALPGWCCTKGVRSLETRRMLERSFEYKSKQKVLKYKCRLRRSRERDDDSFLSTESSSSLESFTCSSSSSDSDTTVT